MYKKKNKKEEKTNRTRKKAKGEKTTEKKSKAKNKKTQLGGEFRMILNKR